MAINIKNSDSAIVLALGTLLQEEIFDTKEIFKKDFFLSMNNIIVKFNWEVIDDKHQFVFVVCKSEEVGLEEECLKINLLSVDNKGKINLLSNEGHISGLLYEAVEEDTSEYDDILNKKAEDDNSFRVNIMSELGHVINLTMRYVKENIQH